MKKIALLGLLALAGAAQAAELYNNGPVVGGGGLSILSLPATTYGFGSQTTSGNSVAEDFLVTGNGWNISSFDFYAYQTGSTSFSLTTATWSVVSGDVNSGTVVASGTTALTNGGLVGYRVTDTTLSDTARGIYRAQADVTDFTLAAGTYWLRWSLTGTLASGPWTPPTADAAEGNAHQSITSGAYTLLAEAGSGLGTTLPFTVHGSVVAVPEPSTYALMLIGGLLVAGVARRRKH